MKVINNNWDSYYLEEAKLIASRSKDSEKVGACIVSKSNGIISKGYNGLPRLVEDTEQRISGIHRNRFMVHAEANAISAAAREGVCLNYSSIYVTHTVCASCAGLIIQCGIDTVVMVESNHLLMMEKEKHRTNWGITQQMFEEAKIYWRFL